MVRGQPSDPAKREEWRRKLSEATKKRFADPESRRKHSEAAKKRYENPEYRRRVSEANRKKATDPEYRERLLVALRKLHSNPEFIIKHAESCRTPESRLKRSESHKGERNHQFGKPICPEHQKKMTELAYLATKGNPEFRKNRCGVNNPNYKNGSSYKPYSPNFNSHNKRRCRHRFGGACALCGKTKEENGRDLSIHHVNVEKLACSESEIVEMDTVRSRLPPEVARFGELQFSEEEIMYIRMWVPLCDSCHGKQNAKSEDAPYEKTNYRKFFTELILNVYGGRCLSTDEEMAAQTTIAITISPVEEGVKT
jgi:hypothetical protein